MIRFSLLFSLLLTTAITAICQDSLQGKWYLFSRNGIVQLNVTNDSLINQQLNWDLTNKNPNRENEIKIIEKQVRANENLYLYLTNPQDSLKRLSLSTVKIIEPKKEIIIAINATDSSFSDISHIEQYISKDVNEKYGLTFYSESEINRLQKQKNIDKMTVEDFKLYAGKVIVFRTELDSLSKLPNAPNGLLYYSYSMMRIIIGQLGYNPMIANSEFGMFIERFQNDPETKEIWGKLFK